MILHYAVKKRFTSVVPPRARSIKRTAVVTPLEFVREPAADSANVRRRKDEALSSKIHAASK
jgi:hypothetical protein